MTEARTLVGRYQLTRLAGEGGMGEVWIANDLQLDRLVAVKVMSEGVSDDPMARQRFLREAQAAGRIQSPHVVQILDYGVEGGTPFIVMELLVGEDLGCRLQRVGALTPDQAVGMLRQLAKGLRKAHEQGFVHRDIKPANLFLAEVDDEEHLKILDFGVVKANDLNHRTATGRLLGSPRYMSPEQARGLREVDPRSDLWSVGVVLFRALTGGLPFNGPSDTDLLLEICSGKPTTASSFDPRLVALDPFFGRCFTQSPAGRFQTIQELVQAFETAVGAQLSVSQAVPVAPASSPASSPAYAPQPLADHTPNQLETLRHGLPMGPANPLVPAPRPAHQATAASGTIAGPDSPDLFGDAQTTLYQRPSSGSPQKIERTGRSRFWGLPRTVSIETALIVGLATAAALLLLAILILTRAL